MAYYQASAGDYRTYGYGGDPGFFSSVWKGIKKLAPIVAGFAVGGPAGAIAAGIGRSRPSPATSFPGVGLGFGVPAMGRGMPIRIPKLPGPKRGGVPLPIPIPVGGGAENGACCPSGFHLAKDGSGRCVRNRSMNVANPRALRRAIRREKGFGKLASRMGYTKRKTGTRRKAACA